MREAFGKDDRLEIEDVRARIQTCEPLDQAAARHQKGMRIYLRDERPISCRGNARGLRKR
jgi:hypothetical protein